MPRMSQGPKIKRVVKAQQLRDAGVSAEEFARLANRVHAQREKSRKAKRHPMSPEAIAARKLRDDAFVKLLKSHGVPEPTREFQFARGETPPRKWAFDFAWPDEWHSHGTYAGNMNGPSVAVEIEGGIWNDGAHSRGKHWLSDAEKYNTAAILGWKVLRITPDQMQDLSTIDLIKRALHG